MDKIIWTYWHQGFNQAPPLVRSCVEQWQKLHPDWQIQLLDQHCISQYAEPLDIKEKTLDKMLLAHQSDLLRTQLLIKYGGVWADPTTFPLKSLNDWLPQQMAAGIFMFYKPGRERIVTNWFIASEKNNIMLKMLYKALIEYWNNYNFRNIAQPKTKLVKFISKFTNRKLDTTRIWFSPLFTRLLKLCPYMVYHFMFYKLLVEHNILKEKFYQMPKISAKHPHALNKYKLLEPLEKELKEIIDQKKTPLLKLDWKYVNDKEVPKKSNLDYLFNVRKK
jgi:hypothetical protein